MKQAERHHGSDHLLFDAELANGIELSWFSANHWREQNALQGSDEGGRGTVHFVQYGQSDWVLRHYRRGGMMARVTTDRYRWSGLRDSRAWREWGLLAELGRRGLQVPRPVAAWVQQDGRWYRAALLMERIHNARTLQQRLTEAAQPDAIWQVLGRTLAELHQAGAYHADLNCRNILLDEHDKVHVVDWDRGEVRDSGNVRWRKANLKRLKRSLQKDAGDLPMFYYNKNNWQILSMAYEGHMADLALEASAERTPTLEPSRRAARIRG